MRYWRLPISEVVNILTSDKLLVLQQAGILGTIAEMLDEQTLLTVICHVDEFCRSIPGTIVKRTLKQLFGDRWQRFLDAYISWTRENYAAKCTQDVGAKTLCKDQALDSRICPPFGPWGLGYDLEIAPELPMANGYAVMAAIQTLNSMALNCENYDFSFIPAEPKECSINRISFLENGRLVWIQYHSESNRYHKNVNVDIFNDETNYQRFWSTLARNDGQVVLRDDVAAQAAINSPGCQEACPKEVGPFEHELWDIGARPHPRCLWSSLWDAAFPTTHLEVRDHIFPVTAYCGDDCTSFTIPSMRFFFVSCLCHIDERHAEPAFAAYEPLCEPLRFVKCTSTPSIVDLLNLETMHFRGRNKLGLARLSPGSRYLGAVVLPEDDDGAAYLAIWRVTLPVPLLVWENGLRLSCRYCYWFIDGDWLITCDVDGTKAYPLTSSMPRCIELIPYVPSLRYTENYLKVCGPDNNILLSDCAVTKSYWLIRFKQDRQKEWKVVKLLPSSDASVSANQNTPSPGVDASSCILRVGKRYVLTTTGDLFDLHVAEAVQPDTGGTINLSRKNQKGYSVLALWESPVGEGAIIACYDSGMAQPMLELFLLNADGDEWQLVSHGDPIRYEDIGLLVFSPDGKKLFVWSHNSDETWGWLILLRDSSPDTSRPEVYIKKLPRFEFTNSRDHAPTDRSEFKYPVFLAEDTIGIVNYKIRKWGSRAETRVAWYNGVDTTIMLVRIDANTMELECSTNWRDSRRGHCPRWIDVLREKRPSLDYCASITYVGTRAGLSPGHRFLLYPAARDPELDTAPHIELCDLGSERQKRPVEVKRPWYSFIYWVSGRRKRSGDVRRSWDSFIYCLKLRKDYRRVPKYNANTCSSNQ